MHRRLTREKMFWCIKEFGKHFKKCKKYFPHKLILESFFIRHVLTEEGFATGSGCRPLGDGFPIISISNQTFLELHPLRNDTPLRHDKSKRSEIFSGVQRKSPEGRSTLFRTRKRARVGMTLGEEISSLLFSLENFIQYTHIQSHIQWSLTSFGLVRYFICKVRRGCTVCDMVGIF